MSFDCVPHWSLVRLTYTETYCSYHLSEVPTYADVSIVCYTFRVFCLTIFFTVSICLGTISYCTCTAKFPLKLIIYSFSSSVSVRAGSTFYRL